MFWSGDFPPPLASVARKVFFTIDLGGSGGFFYSSTPCPSHDIKYAPLRLFSFCDFGIPPNIHLLMISYTTGAKSSMVSMLFWMLPLIGASVLMSVMTALFVCRGRPTVWSKPAARLPIITEVMPYRMEVVDTHVSVRRRWVKNVRQLSKIM